MYYLALKKRIFLQRINPKSGAIIITHVPESAMGFDTSWDAHHYWRNNLYDHPLFRNWDVISMNDVAYDAYDYAMGVI